MVGTLYTVTAHTRYGSSMETVDTYIQRHTLATVYTQETARDN